MIRLSNHNEEFAGGELQFAPPGHDGPETLDGGYGANCAVADGSPQEPPVLSVAPLAGRLMIFSSGRDCIHVLYRVKNI